MRLLRRDCVRASPGAAGALCMLVPSGAIQLRVLFRCCFRCSECSKLYSLPRCLRSPRRAVAARSHGAPNGPESPRAVTLARSWCVPERRSRASRPGQPSGQAGWRDCACREGAVGWQPRRGAAPSEASSERPAGAAAGDGRAALRPTGRATPPRAAVVQEPPPDPPLPTSRGLTRLVLAQHRGPARQRPARAADSSCWPSQPAARCWAPAADPAAGVGAALRLLAPLLRTPPRATRQLRRWTRSRLTWSSMAGSV